MAFDLHLTISCFIIDCPICSYSFCFCFASSFFLSFIHNTCFSVILGFAEQRHHPTNHWFFSAYILTLHSFCLFWVAVFYLKVRELPQLWCRKKTQLDNVKVSQERDRGGTKEALSLARRVHVTRSILPNSGNNMEARIHWSHSRLLFSLALFWRFTKPDKGHQI